MWWVIAIVGLIMIGWFLYSRETIALRLKKDQLKLMQSLLSKELKRVESRKQEIINEGSKQGHTILLAPILENLDKLIAEHEGNQTYIAEINRTKNKLVEKYGTHIPVDVAYKLLTEYEEEHGPV